jgi:hypothetical protein
MGDRTKDFLRGEGWLADGVKIILTIIVSTVVSTVTGVWTIRGMLDDHDKRITIVEGMVKEIKEDIVPRREHEIQWRSQTEANTAIREAVRDVQSDVKTILRGNSK